MLNCIVKLCFVQGDGSQKKAAPGWEIPELAKEGGGKRVVV